MDIRIHAGGIAVNTTAVQGVNYVIVTTSTGDPAAVIIDLEGKICIVSCEDPSFAAVLEQFGFNKRKVDSSEQVISS